MYKYATKNVKKKQVVQTTNQNNRISKRGWNEYYAVYLVTHNINRALKSKGNHMDRSIN